MNTDINGNNDINYSDNQLQNEFKNIRRKFTPEEDERLRNIVLKKGTKKWESIAAEMPWRTGRQCRDRYQNYLVPGFFNGQWSRQEDELLINKYKELGSQWSKMAQFFKNRNANSLKNRWNYYVSKHLKDFSKESIEKNSNESDKNEKNDVINENSISYNSSLDFIDLEIDQTDKGKEHYYKEENFGFLF